MPGAARLRTHGAAPGLQRPFVRCPDLPRQPLTPVAHNARAPCPLRVLTTAPPYDLIGRRAARDDDILVVRRVPLAAPAVRLT